jgi:2-keto-4-pentenoate hydratase/2-oxohepta-3-ene-1,7-dioic acid hydratase in catechol pathway
VWLQTGDVMTLGVDGLGEQRQKVVAYKKGR